jgi:hypothetical protein
VPSICNCYKASFCSRRNQLSPDHAKLPSIRCRETTPPEGRQNLQRTPPGARGAPECRKSGPADLCSIDPANPAA